MPSEVREYLSKALSYIEQESFGRRDAPRVRLSPDTYEDGVGAVSGTLEVSIRTRSNDEALIQREAFDGLKSKTDVDDMLARALSVLLMNHSEWPR
jgi:hypothetical protein